MNNFTEEYMREADCEAIQGFKKQLDYCCEVAIKIDNHEYKENIYRAFSKGINNKYLFSGDWSGKDVYFYKRSMVVWLPSDGWLDNKILKICKERNYDYNVGTTKQPNYGWWVQINDRELEDPEDVILIKGHNNPLIAKIKLLKQLIKESEE